MSTPEIKSYLSRYFLEWDVGDFGQKVGSKFFFIHHFFIDHITLFDQRIIESLKEYKEYKNTNKVKDRK